MPAIATITRSSYQATSHGEDRSTARASCAWSSTVERHCRPVPATVTTSPVGQPYAAQQVVDGVRDDHVVAGDLGHVRRQQAEPLRLGERGGGGRAVRAAPGTGADAADHRLAVGGQLDQRVPGRVADQQVPAVERQRLAGEPQHGVRLGRRHVRALAPVQRALRLVGGDQLVDQPGQPFGVPLAGHGGDHVALRVDHGQGRPRLGRVLLPHVHVGVVEHRVVHAVPLDGRGQRRRVLLVLELRRVHADHDQDVAVLLFERAQLVQHVQAVDAAEGPEIEQDDLAAQVGQRDGLAAGVQPGPAPQFRCPYACAHAPIVPHRPGALPAIPG